MKKISIVFLLALSFIFTGCNTDQVEPDDNPVVDDNSNDNSDDSSTGTDDVDDTVDDGDTDDSDDTPPTTDVPRYYETTLSEILDINIHEEQLNAEGSNIYFSKNGVEQLDASTIESLGIEASGTDKEIADAILAWQNENMIYAHNKLEYNDVSYGMRWANIFPGVYTFSDIIERQVDDGKYYGVCYHYAIVFASIADYYGLTVRIGMAEETPSELVDDPFATATAKGMSGEEYDSFINFMKEKGYEETDFPYDVVRLLMVEGSTHARAEVLLDDEWVPYDTYDSPFTEQADLTYTNYEKWLDYYNPELYDELMEKYIAGEDLNASLGSAYADFLEARLIATSTSGLPGTGLALEYVGIIDDLGQNRAKNVDDLMNGLALAPYFEDQIDILEFFGSPQWLIEEIDDVMLVQEEIEEITGKPYYSVAEILTWSEEDITDALVFAEQYEGFSGSVFNINLFDEYIK